MNIRPILLLVVVCFITSISDASLVGRAVKEGSEQTIEHYVKKGAKKIGGREALRDLAKRFGDETAETIVRVAKKHGKDPEELAVKLRQLGKYLDIKGERLESLVDFTARNGRPGIFLVKRFGFDTVHGYDWTKSGAEDAINEAWRIVDPYAIDKGSWQRLRLALQKAGINRSGRDFCELLFENRARAGRIAGFAKGDQIFDGHVNGIRQGIDFLAPKDGKLRVIEFSTGAKPTASNSTQMSWEWIRNHLAYIAENSSPDKKIMFRGAGYPNELLIARNLRSDRFPIEKYVSREVYAIEKKDVLLKKLGDDIKFYPLK